MSVKELDSLESSYNIETLSSSGTLIIESIKQCFKPSWKMRRINNNGAILVIIWDYLVIGMLYYLKYIGSRQFNAATFYTSMAVIGLMLPILGWLANVCLGRYKVISYSLWIMWLLCLMLTGTLVIADMTNCFKEIHLFLLVLVICIGIGRGGFLANIIQFGIDQLTDSSVTETKAFITWFSWNVISSEMLVHYILTCVKNKLAAPLLLSCNLTVALILNFFLKGKLIKEPVAQNPLELVYRVICYAIKNKHPRQRSAFTYCEDDIPSRIDFGKNKYGGPFTTEQIEDVKTLLRVIVVVSIASAIFTLRGRWYSKFNRVLMSDDIVQSFNECSSDYIIIGTYYITAITIIPLYELIVYPFFCRYLLSIKSTTKFAVGTLIAIARQIVTMTLVIIARKNYMELNTNYSNSTLPCVLYEPVGVLGTYIDYRWTVLIPINSQCYGADIKDKNIEMGNWSYQLLILEFCDSTFNAHNSYYYFRCGDEVLQGKEKRRSVAQ